MTARRVMGRYRYLRNSPIYTGMAELPLHSSDGALLRGKTHRRMPEVFPLKCPQQLAPLESGQSAHPP